MGGYTPSNLPLEWPCLELSSLSGHGERHWMDVFNRRDRDEYPLFNTYRGARVTESRSRQSSSSSTGQLGDMPRKAPGESFRRGLGYISPGVLTITLNAQVIGFQRSRASDVILSKTLIHTFLSWGFWRANNRCDIRFANSNLF